MTLTSATLLGRLRDGGDRLAWERLVALYTPLIRAWLGRQLPQESDVDDVAQQVFTVLVEKVPGFAHNGRPGAFRTWLRGICVNRLRMFWRTREVGAADAEAVLQQLDDPRSELSRQWDREHDESVLRQALALIEPEFKPATWAAFHAVGLKGHEPDAVAAKLGLSVNAVFIAKSRVLRRLREEVAGLVS